MIETKEIVQLMRLLENCSDYQLVVVKSLITMYEKQRKQNKRCLKNDN